MWSDRNKSSSKSASELRMSMSLKVHPAKISKWMVTLLDVHSFFLTKIFRVEEFETTYGPEGLVEISRLAGG